MDSSASRTPRHASGSDLRFTKLSGLSGTHWTRHFDLTSSGSSGYRTYRMCAEGVRVGSIEKRWSFHGAAWG